MNRRGFFTAIAAAVVAGVALPRERIIVIVQRVVMPRPWGNAIGNRIVTNEEFDPAALRIFIEALRNAPA